MTPPLSGEPPMYPSPSCPMSDHAPLPPCTASLPCARPPILLSTVACSRMCLSCRCTLSRLRLAADCQLTVHSPISLIRPPLPRVPASRVITVLASPRVGTPACSHTPPHLTLTSPLSLEIEDPFGRDFNDLPMDSMTRSTLQVSGDGGRGGADSPAGRGGAMQVRRRRGGHGHWIPSLPPTS